LDPLSLDSLLTRDSEERQFFYKKGRKICTLPFSIIQLNLFYLQGELSSKNNNGENPLVLCSMIDESESLLQSTTGDETVFMGTTLLLWAQRSAAHWKCESYETSYYWSSKASELAFDMRIKYHQLFVLLAMAIITKLHLRGRHIHNLEQNLKILSILKEYFLHATQLFDQVKSALMTWTANTHQAEFVQVEEVNTVFPLESFLDPQIISTEEERGADLR